MNEPISTHDSRTAPAATMPPPRVGSRSAPVLPVSAAEQFIAAIGRVPGAAGRFLDRRAKGPPPLRWLVRLFSSVWLGILWLVLVGAYIAVGSGFASLRARLEMTDLQFFDAWPMVTLLILLATNLIVVTLRRIPLTLYKLGVWTVHIGILTLITGCFLYFSQKREGLARIFLNQTVDAYYDATERALYLTRMDPANPAKPAGPQIMVPLPDLPIYYERLARNPDDGLPGNPLDMAIPASALAADPKLQGMNLRITGFYPYAEVSEQWAAGLGPAAHGVAENPGIVLRLRAASMGDVAQWLIAKKPAASIADASELGFAFQYVYHPTADQVADITTPFAGQAAITVRIPKLHLVHTYVAETGKPIIVEGSPYTLTPQQTLAMPLRSAGYEGVVTSILSIDVVRKDADKEFAFERQAVFRFPERSPDFIKTPEGQSKRIQDRVDNDVQISFLDASRDQFWIVEDEAGKLTLVHRAPGGKVDSQPVEVGGVAQLTTQQAGPLLFAVQTHTPNAVTVPVAEWVPPIQRERRSTAQEVITHSVIEVGLSHGDWHAADLPVPFVQFANTQGPPLGRPPTIVDVPGVGPIQMVLSTTRRDLDASVKLVNFVPKKYSGATMRYEDYISTVQSTDKQTGQSQMLTIQLNAPAADHDVYLFQAAWDGDENAPPERRFSVLGFGNRPGIHVMTTGAVLMIIGILYSFYVKPLLLRRRKEQLAAFAASAAGQIAGI